MNELIEEDGNVRLILSLYVILFAVLDRIICKMLQTMFRVYKTKKSMLQKRP